MHDVRLSALAQPRGDAARGLRPRQPQIRYVLSVMSFESSALAFEYPSAGMNRFGLVARIFFSRDMADRQFRVKIDLDQTKLNASNFKFGNTQFRF